MCHDNEKWYKIWRGIDFKIDTKNFTNFDLNTQKYQKFAL